MTLPIRAYGDPLLRKPCNEVPRDYPAVEQLIADMWETMYNAPGVGLAAPQIGLPLRLFIVDSEQLMDEQEERDFLKEAYKGVFINSEILEADGPEWSYEEGCLSIPGIRENVSRLERIVVAFDDENFERQEREFTGLTARIILHEHDHTRGKLFTDYINPLRKRLIKGKLDNIKRGKVDVAYKMLFPANRKRKV